jgi:hypothetical protein
VNLKYPLIAFVGYARAGKDEAAKPLIAAGYNRVCFGDLIKRQLDTLIQRHFGFSAFTEDTAQKAKIRRTLENWGEDNYENIFNYFFTHLPNPAVNTRLCRLREAREWVGRGGIIVQVTRPGVGPETAWSGECVQELKAAHLIHHTFVNCDSIEALHETVRRVLLA